MSSASSVTDLHRRQARDEDAGDPCRVERDATLVSAGERSALAAALAAGLADVIDDLRAIDPVDLVSFIRFGSYPTLEDLLQSATELHFQDGTLTFGWTAGADLAWTDLPVVTLGMEFRHRGVAVFFDLSLRAAGGAVDIASIQFDGAGRDAEARAASLAAALADARLPKRATRATTAYR